MPKPNLPAHLVRRGRALRCSVCGMPFMQDGMSSASTAFANHVREAHKPGQTKEDASQAALRVVRESTEGK